MANECLCHTRYGFYLSKHIVPCSYLPVRRAPKLGFSMCSLCIDGCLFPAPSSTVCKHGHFAILFFLGCLLLRSCEAGSKQKNVIFAQLFPSRSMKFDNYGVHKKNSPVSWSVGKSGAQPSKLTLIVRIFLVLHLNLDSSLVVVQAKDQATLIYCTTAKSKSASMIN
jgi:hypothetical protein